MKSGIGKLFTVTAKEQQGINESLSATWLTKEELASRRRSESAYLTLFYL